MRQTIISRPNDLADSQIARAPEISEKGLSVRQRTPLLAAGNHPLATSQQDLAPDLKALSFRPHCDEYSRQCRCIPLAINKQHRDCPCQDRIQVVLQQIDLAIKAIYLDSDLRISEFRPRPFNNPRIANIPTLGAFIISSALSWIWYG